MRLLLRSEPFHPAPVLGVLGQPTANLGRIPVQPLDALDFRRRQSRLGRLGICFPMALQHRLCRGFELGRLALEVRPRAAPALRRVARQLHAVDGEHLASNQALPIADRQYRCKHPGNVLAHGAHEVELPALLAIDSFAYSHAERVEFLRHSLALGQCVVAGSDNEIAGFGILNYTFFQFGFIPLVVVAPFHRRHGVGAWLLEALERRCSSVKLFSSANSCNVAARQLFARSGFVESGRVENLDPSDPEVFYFKPVLGSRMSPRVNFELQH